MRIRYTVGGVDTVKNWPGLVGECVVTVYDEGAVTYYNLEVFVDDSTKNRKLWFCVLKVDKLEVLEYS